MSTIKPGAKIKQPTSDRIVEILARSRGTWMTSDAIAGRIGVKPPAVTRWCVSLATAGLIEKRIDASSGGHPREWRLP